MSLQVASPGDSDNDLLRKILENESQVIAGTLSVAVTGAGGSATPQYAMPGDSRSDLLRKILINQSQIIAGNMTLHTV